MSDLGQFLTRLVLGVVFIAYGAQKLFGAFGGAGLDGTEAFFASLDIPAPGAMALVVGIVELGGGIALIAGLLTRPVGLALAATMAVAIVTENAANGFFPTNAGLAWPLVLGVVALSLALTGPGRLSLDGAALKRFRRRSGPGPATDRG